MPDGVKIEMRGLANGSFVIPPVTNGLKAWHWTRDSAAAAAYNWAKGGLPAEIIGSPGFSEPGCMEIDTNVNFLRLAAAEGAAFTWMVTFKNNDDLTSSASTQPMLMSTYNGSSGVALWISNHASASLPQARGRAIIYSNTGQVLAVNMADIGPVRVLILRCAGTASGSAISIRELIEAVPNASTLSATRTASGRQIEVGGYYTSTFQGTSLIYQLGVWDQAVTDSETADLLAFMVNDLNLSGIATS